MVRRSIEFSGRLSQRITVQQRVDSADGIGGATIIWQTIATRFAEISVDGKDERSFQGRIIAPQRLRVRCRAETAVTVQHRILWREKAFNVVQVIIDPASPAEIVFYAEQVTP